LPESSADSGSREESRDAPEGALGACPLPISRSPIVLLGHGGGGRFTQELLDSVFLPAFANEWATLRHDGAALALPPGRVAFTTDAFVVRPLFFPGGDIGSLAIHGTVNDLAMCGARPRFLSAAFVLEEGFPIDSLQRIVRSMRCAADRAGVAIVTGDTKVVERGKGDGVYITTTGIGTIEHALRIDPTRLRPGDAILLSGDLGRHGIAILAQRDGLAFETTIESDSAPVHGPVQALLEAGLEVHCLRDLTRGGFATALVEIARASHLDLRIEEDAVVVAEPVRGACEILGLDPFYVANEGRFVCFVPDDQADRALVILRSHDVSAGAVRVGRVEQAPAAGPLSAERAARGRVLLSTLSGASRPLEMLSGEQLPRIC
jgi:hydrogenase expression/formation protein HypE